MSEQDLREIRAFLKEALQASGKRTRVLERALGIGTGKLQSLFDGSLDLRVRHLLAIADVLNIPPEDLLVFTCREARENAKYRITDWLPHLRAREEGKPLPKNLDQLKEVIRATVQEELDERGLSGEPRSRGRKSGTR
jgi:hypothetical protein